MKVSEIAALLGAEYEGEGDRPIRAAAPLDTAGVDEISFVGNRKAAAMAEQSNAGCLLVTPEFPAGRTVIRVDDPRTAFARVLAHLHPPEVAAPGIHPTAVIAPDAVLGENVSIGPHAVIGAGAHIGDLRFRAHPAIPQLALFRLEDRDARVADFNLMLAYAGDPGLLRIGFVMVGTRVRMFVIDAHGAVE